MEKNKIRKAALKERAALPKEDRDRASDGIARLLFLCPEYRRAKRLFSYVSFREEVDTHGLIEQALRDGKQVAVPKVLGPCRMEFYYIASRNDLSEGCMGILEPEGEEQTLARPDGDTLFVVPGAAFDSQGGRIGYGGGFYDAYFSRNPSGVRIGAAFSGQIKEWIPMQEQDCYMDWIVTEKGLIQCRHNCQRTR